MVGVCISLILILNAFLFFGLMKDDERSGESSEAKAAVSEIEPVTVRLGSAGDIILHKPFIESSVYRSDGEYDYSPCFESISDVYESYDFMTVNLETTLAGEEAGYRGYPVFNSPDRIAENLKNSGVDMFLLANNHIYDSGKAGFLRTVNYLTEEGYLSTGIRGSEDELPYVIKDIGSISVGFINYTYETPYSGGKAVNANPVDDSVADLLNSFDPSNTDGFYDEIEKRLKEMREKGAEFIVFYPHWGNEYELEPCEYQKKMASRLCEMGVDVIIGSHPHVVQPAELLESGDGTRSTLCVYSMGNQISNQRREYMPMMSDGHTEDGLIVGLEITRDEKGHVSLTHVEYIPTWVERGSDGVHRIIPADDSGATGEVKASRDRTLKIVDSYGDMKL